MAKTKNTSTEQEPATPETAENAKATEQDISAATLLLAARLIEEAIFSSPIVSSNEAEALRPLVAGMRETAKGLSAEDAG